MFSGDHGEHRLLGQREPAGQLWRQPPCGGSGAAAFHRGGLPRPGADAPLYGLLRGLRLGGGFDDGEQVSLAGYTDTSKHERVRFVIALTSDDGGMRFRLLDAIRSEL